MSMMKSQRSNFLTDLYTQFAYLLANFLVCIMPAINTIGCMCLSVRELVDNTAAGEYFVMCVLDQHIHTDRNLSTTLLTSTSKHKKNNKLKQMSVFVSIG